MTNVCCLIVIILCKIHVSTGGKLTRNCMAANGSCGRKDSTCKDVFGEEWIAKGKCCDRRPCCKHINHANLVSCCPSGFTRIPADSGNCYFKCDSYSNWQRALIECKGKDAYLWEPNTSEEANDVIRALMGNRVHRFWTGASDQANEDIMPSFEQGSGLPFTLPAGNDGPRYNCVAYEQNGFIFRSCNFDGKCVCERNFSCETTAP
ncbi:uncharacterized protein [Mytilus edulis]|uniref:uncharacterized protein isoform X2 n=1 Tax=Mytilus edulis TaxID=6550 RepID=UPI0039EF2E58